MQVNSTRNSHFKHITRAAVLLPLFVLFVGCPFSQKIPENALAVVGKRYLLPTDVTSSLTEMGLDDKDATLRAQVVNRWVDRQILIQEAERLGLHRDKNIIRRTNELRDELMIQKLYETAILVETPEEDDLVSYWQNHTGEFTRVTNEVELIICYAPSRNRAWAVRNGLDRSATDSELLARYQDIRFDTTTSMSVERLPKKIVRAIEPLKNGQASLPFELENQWIVVRLIDRKKAGKPKPLDEMMEPLRARLMAEERANKEISYIASLRREARRNGIVQLNVTDVTAVEDSLQSDQE